jgi:drug/metabolite transporter (DMT)-like permease
MLAFGVGYWLLDFIVPTLGGVTTAFIAKVGDLFVLGAIAVLLAIRAPRESRTASRRVQPFWLWVVPTALLDTAANIAYNIGIATALTSVVVTLSSLFSAVTVVLACLLLRERLAPWQWAGVLTILLGALLVNLPV